MPIRTLLPLVPRLCPICLVDFVAAFALPQTARGQHAWRLVADGLT